MFSSLDRIDIVLRGKDGRDEYVQTDHRAAEEIEEERELSAVFALTRVLNAKRNVAEGLPEPVVQYVMQHRPPDFLVPVIQAAGGIILFGPHTDLDAHAAAREAGLGPMRARSALVAGLPDDVMRPPARAG